jgi:hypothetical protein
MLNKNMRNMVTCQVSALCFVGTVLPLVADTQPRPTPRSFGNEPLHFEPNQGQTDSRVKFLSRGNGYTLFLTPGIAHAHVGS